MIELIKVILEKLNPVEISKALRNRNNRKAAAQLFMIFVYASEVLELEEVLLRELEAALRSRQRLEADDRYFLNGAYLAGLLERQSSTLGVLEVLLGGLEAEVRILDSRFALAFKTIFPGKFSILLEAQQLLSSGRLPLSEAGPDVFPADQSGAYRTLWFSWDAPTGDRAETEKYLHGYTGEEKQVVDVSQHDGDRFYAEVQRYLEVERPFERLGRQQAAVETYRQALLDNFTLEELLSDIGSARRHHSRVADEGAKAK